MSTLLVKGVTYSGTGQMLSRSYDNGVTRNYTWNTVTRALDGLSASFLDLQAVVPEGGQAPRYAVQKDSFTRDVMGRITTSTNEVPVADKTAADGKVTAECFSYDGFNRLSGAWTVAGAGTAACGTAAPANATATGWDASKTAYAATWKYYDGGRIESLVKGVAGAPTTSTYTYTDTAHPAAVTQVTGGATTDSFGYDTAGRMVSRTVNNVSTALTWDVTSSLVESNGQGGHVVYAYDASGQRVVQATLARPGGGTHGEDLSGTATAYVASGQVDDSDTAVAGGVTATRYYTFAGSTVAVRTNNGQLSLMLGDEQGSTNVMMPVRFKVGGALESATLADAAASTRTSYTPYGQLRGADNLATDRGWLGQVEDRVVGTGASSTGTGLTYLNARYYDPATSRFISPDPLMDPSDPRTLDAYMYSSDNPVVYTDASGLRQDVGSQALNDAYYSDPKNKDVSTFTGVTKTGSDGGGLTGGTSSAAGSSIPADVLDLAGKLFNSVDGIKEIFSTVGDLAGEIVHLKDLASQLARDLAAGKKVGKLLAKYRLDRNPVLHYAAQLGRTGWVRVLSQTFGGTAADAVYFLLDVVNHFENDYNMFDSPVQRWEFSAGQSFVSYGFGTGFESSTEGVVDGICLGTGGTGCGGAIVAQGLLGWGIQNAAGEAFRTQVLCEFAGQCPPEPMPTMCGLKDPDGNDFAC